MYGALLGCLKLSSIVLLMPSQEAGRGATAASAQDSHRRAGVLWADPP